MGYTYNLNKFYKIKAKKKDYPWPCIDDEKRIIELFDYDVLLKHPDGTYTKHTGLCCFGILIPDEEVELVEKEITLGVNC